MTKKFYRDYISSYQEYGGFDVKLVAENQAIHTHRLILSAGSHFLKRLLKSVDQEEEPVVIVMEDFTFHEVENLVSLLYHSTELMDPAEVPQIFQELRFRNMGNEKEEPEPQPAEFESKQFIKMMTEEEFDNDQMLFEPLEKKIKTEKVFRCEECDYSTSHGARRLKLHIQKKHREFNPTLNRYNCDECNYSVDENCELTRHKRKKHGGSSSLQALKEEKYDFDMDELISGEGGGVLGEAGDWFKAEALPVGKKSVPKVKKKKEKRVRCDECEFTCENPAKLTVHKMSKHKADPESDVWYECPFENCTKKYRTLLQLTQHKSLNHRELFYCDKCSYSAKFKSMLVLHVKKVHVGVRFICEQCGHEAPNPQALVYHIKNVHEGKTYPCQLCEFVGATYSILMNHKYRNHNTQRFMCEQCPSTFPDRGSLNQHVKKVHSTIMLKCNFCDFSTKFKYGLKRHKENKHKDEIPKQIILTVETIKADE